MSLRIPLKTFVKILVILSLPLTFSPSAFASFAPSAISLYEQGSALLQNYRGNPTDLLEAKKVFTELIERYPNSPYGFLGMSRFYLIDACQYGEHYQLAEVKEQALPYAAKAMSRGPLIPEAHEQYALINKIFIQHERDQQVIQDYLALFPSHPKTFFLIGEFFCDRGEYSMAMESFQKALDLRPGENFEQRIYKRIAWLFLEKFHQPADAIEYYQKALLSGEKSAPLYEFLGRAQMEKKDYSSAVVSLTQARELAQTPLITSYLLEAQGYRHQEQGDMGKAVVFLQDAAALNNEQGSVLYTLGGLFYRLSDYTNAYHYFSKVITMEPQNSKAYYFAGRAAQYLGNTDQALGYYRQVLELKKDGEEATWIRENVPELSHK